MEQTAFPSNFSSNVVTPTPSNKRGNKKTIAAIMALVLLTIGLVSGFLIIRNPVLYKSKATNVVSYQCRIIKLHTTEGQELTIAQVSQKKAGDVVRIVAVGSGAAASYTSVQFTINGAVQPESTSRLGGAGDLYFDYTIPAGIFAFSATAKLKAVDGNWY